MRDYFVQLCAFKFENLNELDDFKEEYNLSKLASLKTQSLERLDMYIEEIDKMFNVLPQKHRALYTPFPAPQHCQGT